MRINIKPLSVNEAWQGRRFKTDKYSKYINNMLLILRPLKIPDGQLHVDVTFGLSSKQADIDNPLKCFIDCLQKKYDFNDNRIYALTVKKADVKKGKEFIEFDIKAIKRMENKQQ